MEHTFSTRIKRTLNKDRSIPDGIFSRSFYAGLKQRTQMNGGSSTDFYCNENPTRGYYVGSNPDAYILAPESFYRNIDLETYFDTPFKRWKRQGFDGVGSWVDPESGDIYVEPFRHFWSKSYAIEQAMETDEKCIFDIENNRSIDLS